MNLVVGATGLLGGEICARLAKAGKPAKHCRRASIARSASSSWSPPPPQRSARSRISWDCPAC